MLRTLNLSHFNFRAETTDNNFYYCEEIITLHMRNIEYGQMHAKIPHCEIAAITCFSACTEKISPKS